jgi:hypothetical protein
MALSLVWLFSVGFCLLGFYLMVFCMHTRAPPLYICRTYRSVSVSGQSDVGLGYGSIAARPARGRGAEPHLYMNMTSTSEVFCCCPNMLYYRLAKSLPGGEVNLGNVRVVWLSRRREGSGRKGRRWSLSAGLVYLELVALFNWY